MDSVFAKMLRIFLLDLSLKKSKWKKGLHLFPEAGA